MKKKFVTMALTGMVMSVFLSGCGSTSTVEETPDAVEEESEETSEKSGETVESGEQEPVEEEQESEEIKEPEIITVYLKVRETVDQDGDA